ncbi:non-hydrolyzing UDP-N-acetylglucosamine 2-epimerase [Legionella nagasakiensis]|uniref:non-hydrolyzing UDP-N-acetylglucosamine 2-epimerase n=1 Tax=Legionella nagasakiensis TaxID=535290 RepID=UPI0010558C75|nr:UDP-N-acetylglucosamine 2-epimerase (non-hydrolyzing) [Legionella nagasakiensis]
MKIITVVGARPQFIKAAALSRCIKEEYSNEVEEILVHTGQHYNENMSAVFFNELGIPEPKYNLAITANTHGVMTGRMLEAIEDVLLNERPDTVLVYGDTNSTLAAALAASKLHTPIAHVEAGLRSFNMRMPEEINRIVADKLSTYLLCPTIEAVKNLHLEGITKGIHQVGDVMYDNALYFSQQAKQKNVILQKLKLKIGEFVLVTCHRAENTDNKENLTHILKAVSEIANDLPVVFPVHPRTLSCINRHDLNNYLKNLIILEPISYLDMVALEQSAQVILTDSGGVQKEAFFYGIPCITMREETEWVETVELGWNQVVGADPKKIYTAFLQIQKGKTDYLPYGDGRASQRIIHSILETEYV